MVNHPPQLKHVIITLSCELWHLSDLH